MSRKRRFWQLAPLPKQLTYLLEILKAFGKDRKDIREEIEKMLADTKADSGDKEDSSG